jgi:tetratricopeptide (TPR) repeat protein
VLITLIKKLTIAVTVVALLGTAAWGQEPQASPWKDRAEYDLYTSMEKEADPAKKIQLLDTYMQKYPASKFKLQAQLHYTMACQELKDADKMYASAQKVLELDPNNMRGLIWITSLTMSMGKTDATFMSNGEKASRKLLSLLAAMQKPANMSDAAFKEQKEGMQVLAHRALGTVAMNRKNNAEAEKEFRTVLGLQPGNGQISYWLGSVILGQRDAAKQSEAFWHFARAANYSGENAMPTAERAKVKDYLNGIYTKFHGSEEGMPEIVTAALKNPFPPAGFTVKSKEVIDAEEDQKFAAENPMLYMWTNLKKSLAADSGYFASTVKNSNMPQMRGYLISQSPETRPDTLVLGIEGRSTREVTLKLTQAYRYPAGRGTPLTFKCVPQRFTAQPFNMGFDCDSEQVKGWPPPPSRKTTR